MDATRTTELVSFGRKVVGVAVLALALAYGPLAMAAPGDGAERATTAGCGASVPPAALSVESGVEWNSSPGMPGKPY